MNEEYEIWEIIPGRNLNVSVEAVLDDWEGFRLLLRDHETNRLVRLAFGSYAAYQNRDEGDFVGEAARSKGLGRGCFYQVNASEFLARFAGDSARQLKNLKHFAIVTDMDCIDILAEAPPRIEHL